MPDLIYKADLADHNCHCHDKPEYGYVESGHWCPPPPPPFPYPPCPPPVQPCPPCNCKPDGSDKPDKPDNPTPDNPSTPEDDELADLQKEFVELTKRANVLKNMINDYQNKNYDVVIKIGAILSYNFGGYYKDAETQELSIYGEKVTEILEMELQLVKEKISELAKQIVDNTATISTTNSTVFKTIS